MLGDLILSARMNGHEGSLQICQNVMEGLNITRFDIPLYTVLAIYVIL